MIPRRPLSAPVSRRWAVSAGMKGSLWMEPGTSDPADAGDEGDDVDAIGQAQVLLGDGAGGDTANCLAGAAPAAAGRGLDAVLLEVCPVGVRGARVLVDGGVAVVLGALVFIHHKQADRGAQVMPNSVPDWISTRSFLFRSVVMADWPGRRRGYAAGCRLRSGPCPVGSRRRCSRRSGSGHRHSCRRGILLSVTSVYAFIPAGYSRGLRGDPEVLARGRRCEKEWMVDLEVRRNGWIESKPFQERAQSTHPKLQFPATRYRHSQGCLVHQSDQPTPTQGTRISPTSCEPVTLGPAHHPFGTCSCSFGAPTYPTGRDLSAPSRKHNNSILCPSHV